MPTLVTCSKGLSHPPASISPSCMMENVRQPKKKPQCDEVTQDQTADRRAPAPATNAATNAKSQRSKKKQTAIFIHAGAGFHSHENEKVHLQACQTYVPDIRLYHTWDIR